MENIIILNNDMVHPKMKQDETDTVRPRPYLYA